MSRETSNQYKIVVLGDTGVGKTSLIVRFVRNAFRRFEATLGVGRYYRKNVELEDSTVTFEIWDTCGIQRLQSVPCIHLPGASVAVVVYDITSDQSLACVKHWVEYLQEDYENMTIVLVGNKIDLGEGTPTFMNVERYAQERQIVHMGASARTARNVENLFRNIATTLLASEDDQEEMNEGMNDEEENIDEAAPSSTMAQKLASVLRCCSKAKHPPARTSGDDEETTDMEEDEDGDGTNANTTPLLTAAERDADTTSSTTSIDSSTRTQRWVSSLFCFKRKRNHGGQSVQVAQ